MNIQEFEQAKHNDQHDLLQPYKVKNAIIMAAGLASRFKPLSDYCPKALLKVKGEVLIERQIRQLQETGISNIIIVVGYKKELYEYLIPKYHVQLVENPEYNTRNNNSSIYAVRESLGNSYVCSGDNYFPENPFEPYVFQSYYAAQYAKGSTGEYCMQTDENGRILQVTVGGVDSYYMLGHTYWDKDFSMKFRKYLENEYDDPDTARLYWEDIYIRHIHTLDMYLKPYQPGQILEFDTLEELCAFDSSYNMYAKTFDLNDLPK